jgi:hypothetical protein
MSFLGHPPPPVADSSAGEFWLHPEAGPDGRMVIKDSAGRVLRGVKAIVFSSAMDSSNELTITVNSGIDGAMTNRAKAK